MKPKARRRQLGCRLWACEIEVTDWERRMAQANRTKGLLRIVALVVTGYGLAEASSKLRRVRWLYAQAGGR